MTEIYGFKIKLLYKDINLDDLCELLFKVLSYSTFYIYVFDSGIYVYIGKFIVDNLDDYDSEIIELTNLPDPDKDKFIEFRKVTKYKTTIKNTNNADINLIINDYIEITKNHNNVYKLIKPEFNFSDLGVTTPAADRAYKTEFPIVFGILLIIIVVIIYLCLESQQNI